MRRMILPLMLLIAVACQPATMELTDAEKAAIADTVRQVSAEKAAAWDSQDAERFFGYFADWSAFPMAGWQSLDAYRAEIDSFWPRFSSWVSNRTEVRTMVLSRDAVVLEGRQVAPVTDTTGASGEWISLYTELWVRDDAGWKVIMGKFYTLEEPDFQ